MYLLVKEMIDLLDRLVNDNLRHFWSVRDTRAGASARPFGNALIRLQTCMCAARTECWAMSYIYAHPTAFPVLQPLLGDTFVLAKCAPTFDFSDESPGNGYRSVLQVVYSCLAVMAQSLDYCLNYRNHVLVCWF